MRTLYSHTHTSNHRLAKKLWQDMGGTVLYIRRTGEIRYLHPAFEKSIKVSIRRRDVPAIVLCRINQLQRSAGQTHE